MSKGKNRKIYKIIIPVLVLILCVELIVIGSNIVVATSASKNALKGSGWGLGYGKEGQPPTGNEKVDYLAQFDAYYIGSKDEQKIYLTFDAGYENGYTEKLLDTLKKNDVKAAFFLVEHYINQNPELVKRMVEEGHFVCNHTKTHPDMTKFNDLGSFRKEIEGLEESYNNLTGQQLPKFYRPPQGRYSEENLKFAKELGYKTIFWSLAYVDWYDKKQPTKEYALNKLLPRMHPGAIILLHSNSKTNSEILEEFIKACREKGYEFSTLDKLS